MTLLIDQNNISENHWVWDFLIAETEKNRYKWPTQTVYSHDGIEFKFAHPVIARNRKNGGGLAFEMLKNTSIGEGAFGSVHTILRTLSQGKANNPRFQAIDKNRVVKDFKNPEDANPEYDIAKDMDHLHAKKPLAGRMVMKRLGDYSLGKFLQGLKTLSRQRSQALCKAILKAYKEQVVDNKVCHNDLWYHFENMLITELPGGQFKVNIIDYGKAYRLEDNTSNPYQDIDFNKGILHLIIKILNLKNLPGGEEALKYTSSFDEVDSYLNFIILAPTYYTQDSMNTLVRFFYELKEAGHPELADSMKEMITEAAQNSNKENGMSPLKEAVITCRRIFKKEGINTPSFPVVAFETDEKKQERFDVFEDYFRTLETKAKALLSTDAKAEGEKLYRDVQRIRETTLDAIYDPEGLGKNKLKDCHKFCTEALADNKIALNIHRDYDYLWAEVGAIFGMLIVGYVAALGVNYLLTKRIGLFVETQGVANEKAVDKNFEELEGLYLN